MISQIKLYDASVRCVYRPFKPDYTRGSHARENHLLRRNLVTPMRVLVSSLLARNKKGLGR